MIPTSEVKDKETTEEPEEEEDEMVAETATTNPLVRFVVK